MIDNEEILEQEDVQEDVQVTVASEYTLSDDDDEKETTNDEMPDKIIIEEETITKPEEQSLNSKEAPSNPEGPVFVHTHFGNKTQPVQFTIIATGQTSNTSITGGQLRLIYGRIYFLPIDIDKSISSDEFANIKIFSDISSKLDVRYISNGYAAILPLQNNIMLTDKTRLCVLW
ncbi:MAG: hypothetical protein ACOC2W_00455 [bacterium]